MQIAISLINLGSALYIIIAPSYEPKDKHWAYGYKHLGVWIRRHDCRILA
jgi:hypothetical protein